MKLVQILGTGCPKCITLTQRTEVAIKQLGIEATIEKVEKITDILRFGIMTTPGLVVDGKVRSAGKVLSVDDIKQHLT